MTANSHESGSAGERYLQGRLGTTHRAARFYDQQVCDRLTPQMREFVGRIEMVFVATADARGECDSSLRAGPPGFLAVLDEQTLAWPEYRGNGVMASLGNLLENPHVGLLMVDFFDDVIGLHVNGRAEIVGDAELRREHDAPVDLAGAGRVVEHWVKVSVEEAYVHCSKNIPRLAKETATGARGAQDGRRRDGDFFTASRGSCESQPGEHVDGGQLGQRLPG